MSESVRISSCWVYIIDIGIRVPAVAGSGGSEKCMLTGRFVIADVGDFRKTTMIMTTVGYKPCWHGGQQISGEGMVEKAGANRDI